MAAHGNHGVVCINNKVGVDGCISVRAGLGRGTGGLGRGGGMKALDGLHQVDGGVLGGVVLHLEFF